MEFQPKNIDMSFCSRLFVKFYWQRCSWSSNCLQCPCYCI